MQRHPLRLLKTITHIEHPEGRRLLTLLITVLLGCCPIRALAAEQATSPTTALTQPAATDPNTETQNNTREAKRVKVNFFINAISNVDDQTGTYEVDFWLDLFWYDPALKDKTIKDVDTATLWQPQVDIVNSRNHTVLFQGYDNSLESDTNVRLSYRFVATLYNKFDLLRFPFDQQIFVIKLESSQYDSSAVLFDLLALEQAPPHSEKPFVQVVPTGKYLADDVSAEGWTLSDARIVQQIRVLAYDKSSWSQFRVELTATRLYGAYLWKIFLVLAFLMALAWAVLLLDVKELRYRLLLLFTLVLAAVTFNFTMLQILPKLTYLTLLDRYMLACYGLLGLVTLVTLLTKWLSEMRAEHWAERLNRGMLLVYPILFLGLHLVVYWYAAS